MWLIVRMLYLSLYTSINHFQHITDWGMWLGCEMEGVCKQVSQRWNPLFSPFVQHSLKPEPCFMSVVWMPFFPVQHIDHFNTDIHIWLTIVFRHQILKGAPGRQLWSQDQPLSQSGFPFGHIGDAFRAENSLGLFLVAMLTCFIALLIFGMFTYEHNFTHTWSF